MLATDPAVSKQGSPPLGISMLAWLNQADSQAFARVMAPAVELAPWVAERTAAARPFADVDALAAAMRTTMERATRDEQLALLLGHPELAGREARAGAMTPESTGEQGRLGLLALAPNDFARLTRLNRLYRERFGFPLIIALRLHADLASVLAAGEARLAHEPAHEWSITLGQIAAVMRGRIDRIVSNPIRPSL